LRKNKIILYVFATLVILVLIVIFIKNDRQIPQSADKPEIDKPSQLQKTPVAKGIASSRISDTSQEKPVKEVAQKQKSLESDSGLTISGTVLLSNGSPAAEAGISLAKMEIGESPFSQVLISSTTADKNGNYTISIHNYPVVFIKASYPGYASLTAVAGSATSRRSAPVSGGKQDVIINFILPPASYVKGIVVDEKDEPIEGVSMTFLFQDRQNEKYTQETTSTNKQGRFEFLNIPPGKIMLGAASLDRAPTISEFTAPADNIILKLPRATASLSGRVFHKITGEPVTSATVRLVYSQAKLKMLMKMPENKILTDSTGFFSFDRLASGQYFIKAEKEGLFMLATDDLPDNRLELKDNEKREGLKIYLYEGHTIKGCVTDKDSGAPIEGVKVRTAWGPDKPREDITDAEGLYILKGLSGTRVGLIAEKENYFLIEEEHHIYHNGINLNPEALELTEDIQMISGLFISGRVETDEGAPATNGQVSLCKMDESIYRRQAHPVDEFGAFKFAVAPFTPCIVKAYAEGFPASFSDSIDVQDKSLENIVIVLKQGASISGVVQDEDKKPVEGAKILAQTPLRYEKYTTYENLQEVATFSDSKGQFKVENLPSGEIVIYAEKENYAKSKQEKIFIKPGEEKTGVIIQLTNSALIAGRITDPEGKPLQDVHVDVYCAWSGTNSHGFAQTDANGNYRIEGLYNAPHNIQLSHKDYGDDFHRNIEVGREDADFVLGANRITLIGNVRDWKTGNPIADFNVSCNGLKPENDPNIPGKFVIKNLTPNLSVRLKIESEGYLPYETNSFSLPQGENPAEKTFELGHGGGVKGRVVNKSTREPIKDVIVHLFTFSNVNTFDVSYSGNEWMPSRGNPTKILTTGEDGVFNFEAVPAESCFIRFIPHEPFKPRYGNVTVKHGDVTDMGDIEISGGGGIRGKLVEMPDEIPAPGKIITLRSFGWQIPEQNAVTNEQGRFEFISVMSGGYLIQANEFKIEKFAEVTDDETKEYLLRIGTGTLKGVVLRKGIPQQSVGVNLYPIPQGGLRQSYTDSTGAFQITGLVPGKWKVSLHPGYYIPNPIEELIDIAAEKVTEKVFDIPSGRIVGKVINAKDDPVQGALISARMMQIKDEALAYEPWTSVSDNNGAFVITDMPSGSYTVSANKKDTGFTFVENVFVQVNADSEPVFLRLDSGKGGTLVSVAMNLTNGQPVPEAWCYLTTAEGLRIDHGRKRSEDGVITITNIPVGTYMVQVSSWGFSSHEHIVEIKDGETVNLEDVMYEAGDLHWTVLDSDGNPVSGALCRVEPLDVNSLEKPREGRTDVQGLWIQRGLYPGGYRVITRLEDGRQATEIIEIQAQEDTEKTAVVK
jgi:protocatechuate 3,4-dioxygenase beta subunit